MKKIEVEAYPGVIALFLPECGHLKKQLAHSCGITANETKQNPYVSIAAPFGCNHRSISIAAIESESSYKYSLKDLYSKESLPDLYDSQLTSVTDSLVTPLVAVPFSIVRNETDVPIKNNSVMLLDVVENVPLSDYQAVAPKIETEVQFAVSFRGTIKGKKPGSKSQGKGTYSVDLYRIQP